MNLSIWHFASGLSFWTGLALIGAAALLYLFASGRILRFIGTVVFFIGVLGVYLSATPLAGILSALLWLLCAAWFAGAFIAELPRAFKVSVVVVTVGFVTAAAVLDYRFYVTPTIPQKEWPAIYVIGDSVSSGIGGPAETAWPIRLGQLLGRPVNNLAIAGATAESAVRRQLPKITQPDSLVFVEIGGNDLLNRTEPDVYAEAMRTLLEGLTEQNQTVVLFELPLLIWHRAYGRLQRQLAREYGVIWVPRTFLSAIFGGKALTSDAVHLTQHGHDVFAEKVYALFDKSKKAVIEE